MNPADPSTLSLLIGAVGLLAGQGRYVQMGQHFQSRGEGLEIVHVVFVVGVLAAVSAIALALMSYVRWQERRNAHSPQSLFGELCKAHSLTWSECQLLWAVAQANGLSHPLCLFVEPERFATASHALTNREGEISALQQRLFA